MFREYHALLLYKLERRDELDRQIEQLALLPNLAPMVGRLQCFRGISLHSAMVLATEIVDWRRLERPGQLACYLGLVSREDSSGDPTRLGSITKAGNSHCRHVLAQTVEANRDDISRTEAPWSQRQVALDRRTVWPKLVAGVAILRASHCHAKCVLRINRSTATGDPLYLNSLNRRMRTRMSGGVGGQ